MSRSESWFRLIVTDRKGTFRGLELEMPLREAITTEGGELTRGQGSVSVRSEIGAGAWSET